MDPIIIVEQQDGLLTLTLNRPDKRNSLSLETMIEITRALQDIGISDADGVIIAANGPVFSAGHNFADMAGADSDETRHIFEICTDMMDTLQAIPQPVIAKVHALATAAGLGVARACHVALAGMGLATLFKVAPWTFDVVRLAGAAYLLWIGIQCLRANLLPNLDSAGTAATPLRWRQAIQRGLLTNLLNPKALLFCSVLLPQFITPGAAPVMTQFALLGVILVAVGLVFDSSYALAGTWVGRWVQRNPTAQRVQQWLFGGLLIGFAVRLAFMQQA
mgnify:CR=1 FL=1